MHDSGSDLEKVLATHFEGKTVLITGATDGIGAALGERLAAAGATPIAVGRRAHADLDPKRFPANQYCRVDLAQVDCASTVPAWLESHGIDRLDYVIHNAGLGYVGRLARQDGADVDALLAVNVRAPLALTHALMDHVARAGGAFVYISSLAAAMSVADYAVYGASKAAVEGFVRSLRIELAARRSPVRTRILRVGATQTGMHPKSGAGRERMDWTKFPPAAHTAEAVLAVLAQRAEKPHFSWTQGAGGRVLHAVGTRLPGLAIQISARGVNKAQLEENDILAAASSDATAQDSATLDTTDPESGDQPGEDKPHAARHCIITGAASGIGRALAFRFGAAGYTITGVDVDRDAAMRTQADLINVGMRARFIVADLANPDQVSAAVDRLVERPPADVLIHCAGISAVGHFPRLTWAEQASVLQVNLFAPIQITREMFARKRMLPGSTLVLVASLSCYTGYPGAAVYAGTKAGIAALGRSLALACMRIGINVLTVFPGPVRTAHARRYSPDNARENQRMAPERVADSIYGAVVDGRLQLLPGMGAKIAAALGTWFPSVTEWAMRRTIFDKLPAD